jgi:hypothetical protein
MKTEDRFSTFPPGHLCGNARSVENSCEFTTSPWKTLRVSHITTKPSPRTLYIFSYQCVKEYADLLRKFIRLLTLVSRF